jgi:hypothetical protein
MTTAQLDALFAGYAEAFTCGDVDRICDSWAYPATITGRGKRASLDAAAFRANIHALLAFYRAQGVASARKRVLRFDEQFDGTALVRTKDRLADAGGAPIASWEHVYIVTDTTEGPRVIMAMADGELDAWQARGTPLGSW